MDCSDAAPYVSLLHDGEPVPADAARHISGCAVCRASLRQWSEVTAHLRLTAAADLAAALPPLALPSTVGSPDMPAWWRRWRSPLRVPRFAAAIVTVALVVSSVGWFRAETGSRVVHQFRAEIVTACDDPAGGRITSRATVTAIVGSRSVSTSAFSHGRPAGRAANRQIRARLRSGRVVPSAIPPAEPDR